MLRPLRTSLVVSGGRDILTLSEFHKRLLAQEPALEVNANTVSSPLGT